MESLDSNSFSSSGERYKRNNLDFRKPVAIHQYRRREKIRGRYGIMLLVYACMLVMLGYFLIEIMKMVQ